MNDKNNLRQKWVNFVKAFASPVPIFSLVGASILIIISITYKDKIEFSILINIIGSLLIGVGGAFIKGGYDELTRESILIKKGQSAIRNLDSIGQQIIQIRNWGKSFINGKDITKRELEEINRHLSTTEINIKSGLMDWVDIVPELRENIEVVKNYEDVIRGYIEEILKNRKELLVVSDDNVELKERIDKKIKELEKNIKDLKKEPPYTFSNSVNALGASVNSGALSFRMGSTKICSSCGKNYLDDYASVSILGYGNICPECRKKSFGVSNFGE